MNAITADRAGNRNTKGGEIAAKKNEQRNQRHHFSLTQFLSTVSHGYGAHRVEATFAHVTYVRYGRDLNEATVEHTIILIRLATFG